MYDDADDQFYQGYPSQVRRRPSILASIITSALTSAAIFFLLRALDDRGYLGRPARQGSDVAVVSPAGAVAVPNLVGVRLDQARELLKSRGLLVSIREERDDATRPAGTVIAQNPLAGSEAPPQATVQVVIARAVSGIIIPPVAGLKLEEAARQLQARGITLGPQKAGTSDAVAAGLVAGSEPAAGTPVAPGTPVSLVVATPAAQAVPKVVGSRLPRGRRTLEEAGFKVGKTIYRYDPCCGEYIILKQTPAHGEPAAPGSTIDLIVNEPG